MKINLNVLYKSLIFLFLAAMVILPANAALQAVSPTVNLATGFPNWYQDITGRALQMCLGTNLDGTGPIDPRCIAPGFATIPDIRINPAGFPDESFFYFAEAPLVINGAAGRFRLLTEAAFTGLLPVNGEQLTFNRASLFTSQQGAFPPNSTFHVVYPFGAFDFSTDAIGDFIAAPGSVFFTTGGGKEIRAEDGPGLALDFAQPLIGTNTGITTFLRSATLNIPGYLGDGVTATPVIGGTNGNVVTITQTAGLGPLVVVGGTDWIVAGKITVIDTIPPKIVSARPASVLLGSTNVVLNADITDNLGVFGVTVDLGPLGNNLTATLNGSQEVPPSTSTATGSGKFTIDTTANTLSINISFTGLSGAPTSAHIHGPALPGAIANVLFDLTPLGLTSPITGTWSYPEASEADILAGRTYVEFHTALFPQEIRGQILPTSNVQKMILTAGNATSGTWGIVIPSLTRAGVFNLSISATDGSNTTILNHLLAVTNIPVVKAVPGFIKVGNLTDVTITVTQGVGPVVNATVDLTGAILQAPQTGITNATGSAVFSVNATSAGAITVTVNSTTFAAPAKITISATLSGAGGDVNNDGAINIVDALFIAQNTVGLRPFTPAETAAADVNLDGRADIVDALFIAQFTVGLRLTL